MYLAPLSHTLKNGKFYIMSILPQFLKVQKKKTKKQKTCQPRSLYPTKNIFSKQKLFFSPQIMKAEKIFHYHIYHITRKVLAFQAKGNDARKKFKSTYRNETSKYM